MPPEVLTLLIATTIATITAGLAIYVLGSELQIWVRRVFLILINLNPWTAGEWRHEFTRRETFCAAWFLVFVLVLIALSFFPDLMRI